jgi:hypothetical protein
LGDKYHAAKGEPMNYLHLFSWYYQGPPGELHARSSYKKLKEGINKGIGFPFDCQYQVGLVHCMAIGEEHWCIGIIIMRGTVGDDSIDQSNILHKWFDECNADFSGSEKDCGLVNLPSIEGTLQRRYPMGDYRSIETFGTL